MSENALFYFPSLLLGKSLKSTKNSFFKFQRFSINPTAPSIPKLVLVAYRPEVRMNASLYTSNF